MGYNNIDIGEGSNNTTINILSKKEDEIEDLITLAEDVSVNIEKLSQKRLYVFVSSVFAFILIPILIAILISYVIRLGINYHLNLAIQILLFTTSVALMFMSLLRINNAVQIKEKIEIEANILGDLLNMIDSLKRSLSDDSLIRKAYFDMRLSRINFEHAKFKKQAQSPPTPVQPTESPVSTSA